MDNTWVILSLLLNLSLNFADVRSMCHNSTYTPSEKSGELSNKKCLQYYPTPTIPPLAIAGGTESLAKEFPHMAAIGYGKKDEILWLCGGFLISNKFVLTAGHCVTANTPKYVRLGDLDLSTEKDDAQPQNFTIAKIILHPCYKPPVIYHDIALLELDREVNFTEYVSPACLHIEKEINETKLTATGWGRVEFIGSPSSILLKVNLDHVPHHKCVKAFGRYPRDALPYGIIENFQICAGDVVGEDTCQGDSGGPLQVKNEERSFAVNVSNVFGITSFGKPCAISRAPAIYTRISNYVSWIESIAWKNETKK